jgi:hypothetical protein
MFAVLQLTLVAFSTQIMHPLELDKRFASHQGIIYWSE